jgi:hypothetical protein
MRSRNRSLFPGLISLDPALQPNFGFPVGGLTLPPRWFGSLFKSLFEMPEFQAGKIEANPVDARKISTRFCLAT